MAIAVEDTGEASATNVSSIGVSITPAGTERFLFVGLGCADSSPSGASGWDFNGDAPTEQWDGTFSSFFLSAGATLVAPDATTADADINLSPEMDEVEACAIALSGVDQSTPLPGSPTIEENEADSTSASISISSSANEIVVDHAGGEWSAGTAGGSQTGFSDQAESFSWFGASYLAHPVTAMTWSGTSGTFGDYHMHHAFRVAASGGGGPETHEASITATGTVTITRSVMVLKPIGATGTPAMLRAVDILRNVTGVGTGAVSRQPQILKSITATGTAATSSVIVKLYSAALVIATATVSMIRAVLKNVPITATGTATRQVAVSVARSVAATGTATVQRLVSTFRALTAVGAATVQTLATLLHSSSVTATGTASTATEVNPEAPVSTRRDLLTRLRLGLGIGEKH